jgi:mannose-1-phosphate guanylyltransferase
MAIVTADHLIQECRYFQRCWPGHRLAHRWLPGNPGHPPTFPATGYGYIQRGEALEGYDFLAYEVKRFKEKPDEETARSFITAGDHDWNSGMFVWRVARIWEEFQRLMPELAQSGRDRQQAWDTDHQVETVQDLAVN